MGEKKPVDRVVFSFPMLTDPPKTHKSIRITLSMILLLFILVTYPLHDAYLGIQYNVTRFSIRYHI